MYTSFCVTSGILHKAAPGSKERLEGVEDTLPEEIGGPSSSNLTAEHQLFVVQIESHANFLLRSPLKIGVGFAPILGHPEPWDGTLPLGLAAQDFMI